MLTWKRETRAKDANYPWLKGVNSRDIPNDFSERNHRNDNVAISRSGLRIQQRVTEAN